MSVAGGRLSVRGVSKSYPGVRALSDVDLSLGTGEVLGLVGENGAGKSTLTKVLAGIVTPDAGSMTLEGRPYAPRGPREAQERGLALIHQELGLADNLDVAANVFLGRELRSWGLLDHRAMRDATAALLERVGADFGPDERVSNLSIGRQQLVEIVKALALDARVLIMDEPTSSLSSQECERLFEVVHGLRARGASIVYISHRLGEIHELCDRVTVLRDGCNAGELSRGGIDHDAMVNLMVGRDLKVGSRAGAVGGGEAVLEVRNLVVATSPGRPVSFTVRAGECVGIAGLVGAGRTELLETLFGLRPPLSGEVRLRGERLDLSSPRGPVRSGVGLVPEERKRTGIFPGESVQWNTGMATHWRRGGGVLLDPGEERRLAERTRGELRIKVSSLDQDVAGLSGGNQQKVVIARWLLLEPRLLLLDEPTRGIDVGARLEIYKLLEELTDRGVAVLFVSSELEEVLHLADRVLVLREGALTGELGATELGEEAIMQLATQAPEAYRP